MAPLSDNDAAALRRVVRGICDIDRRRRERPHAGFWRRLLRAMAG